MNKLLNIEELISKINLSNINYKIIKINVEYLTEIFIKIQKIWKKIPNNINSYSFVNSLDIEYKQIYSYITTSPMNKYDKFSKYIDFANIMVKFEHKNIKFYYICQSKTELNNDLTKIINLFKIGITLEEYFKTNTTKKQLLIIWIPILAHRDFQSDIINLKNLTNTTNNFQAFSVSGVSFSNNMSNVTIITRYEEISKLLIHELMHNLKIDGTKHHNYLLNTLVRYKKLKPIGNFHYDYSIYESYAELTGTYLTMLFINIDLCANKIHDKLFAQILIEIIYSYNTVANLIKINKYQSISEFNNKKIFAGDICVYEYYYIKALLYNNFKLTIPNDIVSTELMYNDIINISLINDKFLAEIFNNSCEQTNFAYSIISKYHEN